MGIIWRSVRERAHRTLRMVDAVGQMDESRVGSGVLMKGEQVAEEGSNINSNGKIVFYDY